MAARSLFLAKGFDTTTMRDVMHSVNIAKGTIYHYFSSKEELLDAVIEHIAQEQYILHRNIFASTTGNAIDRIKQLVLQGLDLSAEHEDIISRLHQPANAGMHIRLLARHIALQAPLHADLIQQGCEEGVFATESPLETAEFILSGIRFLIDIGVYPWQTEEIARRMQSFPGIVESLLSAPPGSFGFLATLFE